MENTLTNVYKKMFSAKKMIAETKIKKGGENTFSKYNYFTPEQINQLVNQACIENDLLTIFSIVDEVAWLEIIDIDSGEQISITCPIAIPEIKATNKMQQIGGVITYAERYLKMTAFGIVDNNLDFDTTENTKKTAEQPQNENTKTASTPPPATATPKAKAKVTAENFKSLEAIFNGTLPINIKGKEYQSKLDYFNVIDAQLDFTHEQKQILINVINK